MLITVFTPTYNRGYIIGKLYESLKRQTFKDFEWLIVDDGSTDNTGEIVSNFINEKPFFPIRYIKTENGGKHRAINKGVQLAQGDLFFTVDSDDYIPEQALKYISDEWINTKSQRNFVCALFGLRCHKDGSLIGKTFEGERIVTSSIDAGRHGIRGDKGEVFVTEILKHYPYPEIECENFSTEAIIWDRMSHDGYKYIYFNKWICTCEYLDDGLTHQGRDLYACNPVQWSISLGQNYLFAKYTRAEMSPQIYVYYQHVKDKLSVKEMSQLSGLSQVHIMSAVILQSALNIIRRIAHKPILK